MNFLPQGPGTPGATGADGADGVTIGQPNGGRITLESNVAVSQSDQNGKTTIYFTPHVSEQLAVNYGGVWLIKTLAQLSIAVPSVANAAYDLFVYWTGAALALEAHAWTDTLTRATGLTFANGAWYKSGDITRRYVGSFLTTSVAGQVSDGDLFRGLWNLDNRCFRRLKYSSATASWTYTNTTKRQWNGDSGVKVEFFCGMLQDVIQAQSSILITTAGSASSGLGLNSTTAYTGLQQVAAVNSYGLHPRGSLEALPRLGYNYIAGVEDNGDNLTTSTFYGTSGSQDFSTGIEGRWAC